MKTRRRASSTRWAWRVVGLPAPRAARITGFIPRGRSAKAPATALSLPPGWHLVQAASFAGPETTTLSQSTRSTVGALTWYEQPLTLAR